MRKLEICANNNFQVCMFERDKPERNIPLTNRLLNAFDVPLIDRKIENNSDV